VSAAVQTVDYLNVGLFTILAIAAFLQWRKGGGRPSFWATLAFGPIGIAVLAGLALPEDPQGGLEELVTHRHPAARPVPIPLQIHDRLRARPERPRAARRPMTAVLVVWAFALPDSPAEELCLVL
jgi:hypothetical protein